MMYMIINKNDNNDKWINSWNLNYYKHKFLIYYIQIKYINLSEHVNPFISWIHFITT